MEEVWQLVIVRLIVQQKHLVRHPVPILLSEGFGSSCSQAPVITCNPSVLNLSDELLDSVGQILDGSPRDGVEGRRFGIAEYNLLAAVAYQGWVDIQFQFQLVPYCDWCHCCPIWGDQGDGQEIHQWL
jgi:hypothetical protein